MVKVIHKEGGRAYPSDKPDFKEKQALLAEMLKKNPNVLKVNKMQSAIKPDMKEKASMTGAVASKSKIEESGHNPETEQLRKEVKETGRFFSTLLAFIKTALSYLNIFAYFHKKPEKSSIASEEIEIPEVKRSVSPEKLSDASILLIATLAKNEAYLKEEGIFRISGSKATVDELVKQLTESSTGDLQEKLSSMDPPPSVHDLTGALKEIFGQMTLFSGPELKKKFLQLGISEESRIAQLKELVGQLPDEEQKALKDMIELLAKVSEFKDENQMTVSNLAVVFGPRLVSIQDPMEMMSSFKQINEATESLINHQKRIFE